jgi:hypothetical protein
MPRSRPAAVLSVLVLGLALAVPASAIQLMISYPVLEGMLQKSLFRDQGRYYVSGSSADECNYAFLERPRLGAQGGRLTVRLHFDAFTGAEVGGECVGSGDDFDIVVTGVPKVVGGTMVLADPQLSTSGRPAYEAMLRPLVTGALAQGIRFDLAGELNRLAANATPEGYRVQISGVEISSLRPTSGWLEVGVELTAALTESRR